MQTALPSFVARPKTKSQLDRETYEMELKKPILPGETQLVMFNAFVADTPAAYTNLLEFFDAIPKFVLSPQTSLRKGGSLQIQQFEFTWGETLFAIAITPVVVESRDEEGRTVRKEVLPGPREDRVYRVLKKMASDPNVQRVARENSVVMRFSLHHLRTRLREVNHEYKVWEIREALEVLNRSPLSVTIRQTRKKLYSGPYIGLCYVQDTSDLTGERSLVEVSFNDLAVRAITAGVFDRIHYKRLMSLGPLAAWIYELITRNFRQANGMLGYKISLGRIIKESGLPTYKDLRGNLRAVRKAIDELVDRGVLATFPKYKEEVTLSMSSSRGRRKIDDVVWTLFPHEEVVNDIKEDNAVQAVRRARRGRPALT